MKNSPHFERNVKVDENLIGTMSRPYCLPGILLGLLMSMSTLMRIGFMVYAETSTAKSFGRPGSRYWCSMAD
jgi:hypothetical protein